MAVLCFHLLVGQSMLNVPLLGFIFEGRQSLLELPDILLLSGSALSLVLTYTRQALGVLHRDSQAPAFWVIWGILADWQSLRSWAGNAPSGYSLRPSHANSGRNTRLVAGISSNL